ncbi:MAG: c-type cytochrome [Hyphomicrobiales bacterium]
MQNLTAQSKRRNETSDRVMGVVDHQLLKFKSAAFAVALLTVLAPSVAKANPFPDKLEGHGGPIRSIAVSDDGKTALTASFDYGIIVWDLSPHGAKIRHRLSGHDAAVNDAVFVSGSNEIVSVSDDGSFAIWNSETGELLEKMADTPVKVLDAATSPDGKMAAIARWDGTARLFDIKARKEIAKLEGHRGNVNSVTFSTDSKTVYTGSYDGTVRAWRSDDGALIDQVYNHGWGINVIAAAPDNTLFFGGLDGTVSAVDAKTGTLKKELSKFDRPVLALTLSPDGKTLASGNGAGFVNLYDTTTLTQKRDAAGSFGPIWGIAFTGNNDALYLVGLDDFASWHPLGKGAKLKPVKSKFPRRFQLSNAESEGQLEFQRKCSVCHTLTPDGANRAGPTLYDVFGRKAGTLDGYTFSKAIIASNIIWNAKTIAQLFDDGPDVMIPGTKMPVQRLKSIERRDELVEFLKKATAPQGAVKQGDTKQ